MGDVGENYRISDIDFSAQSLAYVDVAVCTEKVCDMVLKNFLLMNIWLHLVHVYYKNIFIARPTRPGTKQLSRAY